MSPAAYAFIVAGIVALPVAASAAPNPSPAPPHVSRQTIVEFARCVITRHRREAADYVLRKTPRVWQISSSAERRLGDRDCIPRTSTREDAQALLKMHKDEQLRPALAEALVREEFATFEANLINTAQPLEYGKLVDSLWAPDACRKCRGQQLKDFEQARARSNVLMAPLVFGECVVRTDPASAHRLLIIEPGSSEETSILNALQPALSNCVADGARLNTNRRAVREVVALNYYRLAHAPRVQTAAGAPK